MISFRHKPRKRKYLETSFNQSAVCLGMRMQREIFAGIFFFSFEQIVLSSFLTGYMLNFILRKEKKGNLIS